MPALAPLLLPASLLISPSLVGFAAATDGVPDSARETTSVCAEFYIIATASDWHGIFERVKNTREEQPRVGRFYWHWMAGKRFLFQSARTSFWYLGTKLGDTGEPEAVSEAQHKEHRECPLEGQGQSTGWHYEEGGEKASGAPISILALQYRCPNAYQARRKSADAGKEATSIDWKPGLVYQVNEVNEQPAPTTETYYMYLLPHVLPDARAWLITKTLYEKPAFTDVNGQTPECPVEQSYVVVMKVHGQHTVLVREDDPPTWLNLTLVVCVALALLVLVLVFYRLGVRDRRPQEEAAEAAEAEAAKARADAMEQHIIECTAMHSDAVIGAVSSMSFVPSGGSVT